MESSSLFRIVRRLPIVVSPVLLVATLLLAGCGSSGGVSSVSATADMLSDPRGIVLDSSRNLYIADAGAGMIHTLNLNSPGTGSSINVGNAVGGNGGSTMAAMGL